MINKLTTAQVEKLKALLVLGYTYIARDADCSLYAYMGKPFTHNDFWFYSRYFFLENCFSTNEMQFIKWLDCEPTLIKDLIKGEKNE